MSADLCAPCICVMEIGLLFCINQSNIPKIPNDIAEKIHYIDLIHTTVQCDFLDAFPNVKYLDTRNSPDFPCHCLPNHLENVMTDCKKPPESCHPCTCVDELSSMFCTHVSTQFHTVDNTRAEEIQYLEVIDSNVTCKFIEKFKNLNLLNIKNSQIDCSCIPEVEYLIGGNCSKQETAIKYVSR